MDRYRMILVVHGRLDSDLGAGGIWMRIYGGGSL